MRLGFIADVHIKLRQKNIPTEWLLNRLSLLAGELNNYFNEGAFDALVIGGDVFDTIPTIQEVVAYSNFISSLSGYPVYLFSGNHEMISKRESFLPLLQSITEAVNPKATVVVAPTMLEDTVYVVPYNFIKDKEVFDKEALVLMTHVRGAIPPYVEPEIDLDLLSKYKLVLAGDLHSHSNSQLNIVYPGSPFNTTFSRNKQVGEYGMAIVDSITGSYTYTSFDKLPQLIRTTIKAGDPIPDTSECPDHVVFEVEGSAYDLQKVEKSDKIDKTVIVDETAPAKLDFSSAESFEAEIAMYLKETAKLSVSEITELLDILLRLENKESLE